MYNLFLYLLKLWRWIFACGLPPLLGGFPRGLLGGSNALDAGKLIVGWLRTLLRVTARGSIVATS